MKPPEFASPTFVDRVVGVFSPKAAAERIAWRTRLGAMTGEGGYKGGRRDRRATRNWRPKGGSADADTLPDLQDLRARSRDHARNTPIATGAVATKVTGVLGAGLTLQASIDSDALGISAEQADHCEREQEREFAIFCKRCDFTRVQEFDELQELIYRSSIESGDALIVRRYRKDAGDAYGTKLQLLEADRLSNPSRVADTERLAGGVEVDKDGAPVSYHISSKHPGNLRGSAAMSWEAVPARTTAGLQAVIHLYTRLRPELTRGVPFLAPVIEHLKQIGDYSDAEVTAAVIGAMTTLVIETPTGEDDGTPPAVGEKTANTADNEVELGAGAAISLAPGEKANLIDPSRPNANYDPFWLAFMRQIGVALEIPVELLIKHFTASYSASRAALEMAWLTFSRDRARFAAKVCQVVYGWAMDEAVATGRLARPGWFADPGIREAWLGAEWIGPRRFSLNPQQEAGADKLDWEMGTKTGEQICIERTGGEIEKKIAQRKKEIALSKDAGLVAVPLPAGGGPTPDEQDANERRNA